MRHETFIKCGVAAVLAMAAIFSAVAWGDSTMVSYQGTLRNADGTPLADGAYPMTFSVWDALTNGNKLWQEVHSAVTVKDGLFSVQLGDTTALGTIFNTHSAVWVQVEANTGPGYETFAPRVSLSSTPYAKQADQATSAANATHASTADSATTATSATNATHATSADSATTATNATNAGNSDTVDGQHASAFSLTSHTHDASQIVSGTLSTDRFSAYADLVAEGKIGAGSTQVAAGNHTHPDWYFVGSAGAELSGTKSIVTAEANGITNDGHNLVVSYAGKYLVHFQQLTQVSGAGTYLSMVLDGSTILCYAYLPTGCFRDMLVTRIVTMNAGEYISFRVDTAVQTQAWGAPHSTITMYYIGN